MEAHTHTQKVKGLESITESEQISFHEDERRHRWKDSLDIYQEWIEGERRIAQSVTGPTVFYVGRDMKFEKLGKRCGGMGVVGWLVVSGGGSGGA